ncbi:MAG: hypothetical protein KDK03_17520 [Rhodobacteraceae bacterium]|nr:hypothetical protein [Paracoccaceae bacterium]
MYGKFHYIAVISSCVGILSAPAFADITYKICRESGRPDLCGSVDGILTFDSFQSRFPGNSLAQQLPAIGAAYCSYANSDGSTGIYPVSVAVLIDVHGGAHGTTVFGITCKT